MESPIGDLRRLISSLVNPSARSFSRSVLAFSSASHDADVGDGCLHHLFLDNVVTEMSASHNADIVFRMKVDQI